MAHLCVDQTVGDPPSDEGAATEARPDGDVHDGVEPLRCPPAPFTERGTVHVGVEADGHAERGRDGPGDVGVRPARLGGRRDEPE